MLNNRLIQFIISVALYYVGLPPLHSISSGSNVNGAAVGGVVLSIVVIIIIIGASVGGAYVVIVHRRRKGNKYLSFDELLGYK